LAQLGERLGHSAVTAAWGVHDIVAENMAAAARVHVSERGQDPRNLVVVATGGGGPLHAYYVARKMGISTIISPPEAGVASAFGLLVATARADRSRTVSFHPASDDLQALEAEFHTLEADVLPPLQALDQGYGPVRLLRRADGRFVGQGFNLTVDLPAGPYDSGNAAQEASWRQQLDHAFRSEYQRKFGRIPPDVPVQLVNLRITAEAPPRSPFQAAALPASVACPEPVAYRSVYFHEARDYVRTPIFRREQLRPGFAMAGPVLVEEPSTTVVVGPLGHITLTANANLVITVETAQ
jgi:N-methylhydantoinase A/oxoprolinase/acetone carboxylase beta subunit